MITEPFETAVVGPSRRGNTISQERTVLLQELESARAPWKIRKILRQLARLELKEKRTGGYETR